MSRPVAIGIDLGGTNTRAALVNRAGRILRKLDQPTRADRGPQAVPDHLADMVDRLIRVATTPSPFQGEGRREGNGGEMLGVAGIGLATPGPLNLREGRIIHAANLPGWKDVPIRDMLGERVGLPVVLENDGNAAAYGEYRAGAGRGCDPLVMLTLGTGVGAGVILDGRILHGYFDNAAELGHMIVVVEGLPCPCGQRGCLERYASADAVVRRVLDADPSRDRESLGIFPPAPSFPVLETRTNPLRGGIFSQAREGAAALRAEDVALSAAHGDPLCQRIWDEACLHLAVACVNIQHAYNPKRILLGGGMSLAGDFLLNGVQRHLGAQTWSLYDDAPEVALAALGPDAGLIGAAMLAFERS